MIFNNKKWLISSTILLILMFGFDVINCCSGGESGETTSEAEETTATPNGM